jgi:hypothetical protein
MSSKRIALIALSDDSIEIKCYFESMNELYLDFINVSKKCDTKYVAIVEGNK